MVFSSKHREKISRKLSSPERCGERAHIYMFMLTDKQLCEHDTPPYPQNTRAGYLTGSHPSKGESSSYIKVQEELQKQIGVFTRCGGCATSVKQELIRKFLSLSFKCAMSAEAQAGIQRKFLQHSLNKLSMIQYSFHSHHRCLFASCISRVRLID